MGSSTVLGIRREGKVEVKAGMVFHVLSWITDEQIGDHFVSDTVIVGKDRAEVITTTPHRLLLG